MPQEGVQGSKGLNIAAGQRGTNASRHRRLRSTPDQQTERNYVLPARPSDRRPLPPPPQPTTPSRLDDFFQLCRADLLELRQGTYARLCAGQHRVRYGLAKGVAVTLWRDLFADVFKSGRHVGDRTLIETENNHSNAALVARRTRDLRC